ncbi:transposase [Enterococcus faecalis]|uniref:transposase n=1 Tax=Enterococcus faecalis TaxID=1351 RepID=UPI00404129B0
MPIAVPIDKEGEFEPTIVNKNQSSISSLEERIIAMYAKSMSTRDIQDHFNDLYGSEMSPTFISNVLNKSFAASKGMAKSAVKNNLRNHFYECVSL